MITSAKGFKALESISLNKSFRPGDKKMNINPNNADMAITVGLEATRGTEIPIKIAPAVEKGLW